jgi:hypothetical protein
MRMLKLLQRRGLLQKIESENGGESNIEPENIETILQGTSGAYKVATGPNSGQKV